MHWFCSFCLVPTVLYSHAQSWLLFKYLTHNNTDTGGEGRLTNSAQTDVSPLNTWQCLCSENALRSLTHFRATAIINTAPSSGADWSEKGIICFSHSRCVQLFILYRDINHISSLFGLRLGLLPVSVGILQYWTCDCSGREEGLLVCRTDWGRDGLFQAGDGATYWMTEMVVAVWHRQLLY